MEWIYMKKKKKEFEILSGKIKIKMEMQENSGKYFVYNQTWKYIVKIVMFQY